MWVSLFKSQAIDKPPAVIFQSAASFLKEEVAWIFLLKFGSINLGFALKRACHLLFLVYGVCLLEEICPQD